MLKLDIVAVVTRSQRSGRRRLMAGCERPSVPAAALKLRSRAVVTNVRISSRSMRHHQWESNSRGLASFAKETYSDRWGVALGVPRMRERADVSHFKVLGGLCASHSLRQFSSEAVQRSLRIAVSSAFSSCSMPQPVQGRSLEAAPNGGIFGGTHRAPPKVPPHALAAAARDKWETALRTRWLGSALSRDRD